MLGSIMLMKPGSENNNNWKIYLKLHIVGLNKLSASFIFDGVIKMVLIFLLDIKQEINFLFLLSNKLILQKLHIGKYILRFTYKKRNRKNLK